MTRRHLLPAIMFACATAGAPGTADAALTFTRFGQLPAGNESYFRALADDGSVAYGDSLITGDPATDGTIFRFAKWTPAAGLQDLGNGIPTTPAPHYNYSTIPNATSADGRVVVGSDGGTFANRRAFRWSAATGFEYYGSTVGIYGANARAVSPDGSTSLIEVEPGSVLAWKGNTTTLIPNMRQATGVSTNGAVIAGNADILGTTYYYYNASRWTSATGTQLLPTLGSGSATTAGPVTPDGTIAGHAASGGSNHLVLWPATGGIVDLGPATAGGLIVQTVYAITPDARTIAGSAYYRGTGVRTGLDAFIWNQSTGFTRVSDLLSANGIDLGKFSVNTISDVSADGQTFLGYLAGPNGSSESFLLTLPEPAAAASLLPLAALLLSSRRYRHGCDTETAPAACPT